LKEQDMTYLSTHPELVAKVANALAGKSLPPADTAPNLVGFYRRQAVAALHLVEVHLESIVEAKAADFEESIRQALLLVDETSIAAPLAEVTR
jgi:hypothetical protein